MFVKIESTTKIDEPVRQELLSKIYDNGAKIKKMGYRFDMGSALDSALQDIIKQQQKFMQKSGKNIQLEPPMSQ